MNNRDTKPQSFESHSVTRVEIERLVDEMYDQAKERATGAAAEAAQASR